MNWVDIAAIAVIAAFGIIGLTKGFVFSIFRLVSFFASVIISIKFYPKIAAILTKTNLYTGIKTSFLKSLMKQKEALIPATGAQVQQASADSVIHHLKLPEFLKDSIIRKMPNPSELIDVTKVMDLVSEELAGIVISVISLVLLYLAVRIVLAFVRFILQGIAKLPVFRQMDKLGGFIFGALEGLLTLYILCAVLMLFNAAPWSKPVFEAMEGSSIAKFFYENNFIITWMFPK